MDLETLPFSSSSQGVYLSRIRGFSVSSCGDKVWAGHIIKKVNKKYISRLMMYDFQKESHFFYDYEHQDLILSILVSEVFKLAMSGGSDETLVLHDLESGKTIKRFDMKYGSLLCLFDLGTAVAVGDYDIVRILDLEKKEMGQSEVKAGVDWINCMNLSIGGKDRNDGMTLLVGGKDSIKIDKISIPEAIAENGKSILEMRHLLKNTEKFMKKMFDLQKENKQLREENQRFKDQLDKEENGKVYAVVKYQKKIMELSKKVKTQETINEELEEELDLIENQLISTQKENEILTKTNQLQRQKLDVLSSQLRKQKNSNQGTPNLKISETKSPPFQRQTNISSISTRNISKRTKILKKSSKRASPEL